MYIPQVTADRIKKITSEKGMSLSQLNEKCGLSVNVISQSAKSKEGMKARNLYLIAETLDCSVDYLLGRTDEPQQKTEFVKDSNNTGGVHVFDFTVPVTTYPATSEQQQEIDRMMSDLSPRERNKLMGMIYDYYDECKKESE